MTERKWTRRRVLRAYEEWSALEKHAKEVFDFWRKQTWRNDISFERLALPGWFGTGWPGKDFDVVTYDDEFRESDHPESLPFEYLWTDAWREKLKEERAEQEASAAGRERERQERAEFERLKAKYAGEVA